MKIEVIYALPQYQHRVFLDLDDHATAIQAIEQSGILQTFPELSLKQLTIGVFNQIVQQNHSLNDGDRVEIYRPLTADPKDIRRRKVALKKHTS